jgi:hypothetical protein
MTTIELFAARLLEFNPNIAQCYIALIKIDGKYDLDVEIDGENIAATYRTDEKSLKAARQIADELDAAIKAIKPTIRIALSRYDWREWLDGKEGELSYV